MATISTLAADEIFVVKLDAQLRGRQQEDRLIYLTRSVADCLQNDVPGWTSAWNIDESPLEQLDALFAEFVAGEPLEYGTRFKKLRPRGNGIWELKTADVRIIGWFAHRDCFVAARIVEAHLVKAYNLYRALVDEVIRIRDGLRYDEPKFVLGDEAGDVVSDYT
jgi:hypothetical protein